MVVLKIRSFGRLAEILPVTEIGMEGMATTGDLKARLVQYYPEIAGISFSVAVNSKLSPDDLPLKHGDTIALLPPFSGG